LTIVEALVTVECMPTTASVAALLHTLAERARHDDGRKKLRSAVGVVGDLGRVVARDNESDIRVLQSAVASLREQLETGDIDTHPATALDGPNSHSFLAGAMWAVNELMTSRLAVIASQKQAPVATTRRGEVEEVVLACLRSSTAVSPGDILESVSGRERELRGDEVSKALSALLAAGRVEQAASNLAGADRRRKYFRLLPDAGADAPEPDTDAGPDPRSQENSRHVVPNRGGGWDVVKPGAQRSSSHHDTQSDAIDRGREIVGNLGGGELRIHGRDGRIRDSDTVAPGNDPNPPRDAR
jgi:hypothetical protein